jgi:hypothetical protein
MLSNIVRIRTAAGILEIQSQVTCRSFNTIFVVVFVITSRRGDDQSPACLLTILINCNVQYGLNSELCYRLVLAGTR